VPLIVAAFTLLVFGENPARAADDRGREAEAKAIAYLQREVPAWRRENGCFSCHNNGDAVRALYAAAQQGYQIRTDVLAETTAWLAKPAHWDENKGDPGYNDTRLANLQFAAALVAAFEARQLHDRTALARAAQRVVAGQGADGAWQIEPGNAIGSPATYGTTLATFIGWRILRSAPAAETDEPIRKAGAWLRKQEPNNVLTAATLILALTRDTENDPRAVRKRDACLDLIRRGQTGHGGWGPFADAPPEPFDTALVLLALSENVRAEGVPAMIRRGRAFLVAQQNANGSWPATTRPPGGESYAQSISTTGWATLALLATRK